MREIKVVILKRNNEGELIVQEKVIEDTLSNYYEILSCDNIDIVTRKIKGFRVCFVIDDEYLLRNIPNQPPVAVFVGDGDEAIYGSLVITGKSDEEGKLSSLDDNQINIIEKSIHYFRDVAEHCPNLNPIYEALSYSI